MNENLNILPLRMIRIAKDNNLEQMAKHFQVTTAYISAIENGKRKINFRTLKYGLDNMGITIDEYISLCELRQYLLKQEMEDRDKYKYMLIKTLGVVAPEIKELSEMLLNNHLLNYSSENIDVNTKSKTRT